MKRLHFSNLSCLYLHCQFKQQHFNFIKKQKQEQHKYGSVIHQLCMRSLK
uniref:Uncharacterized protein n=1 Tax=Anguilla anguilla TaxID=7936 RepID=A0A0E9XIK7_ANGAN